MTRNGKWGEQSFLIDTGADATCLHFQSIRLLGIDTSALQIRDDASGIGGTRVPHIRHPIKLMLRSPSGEFRLFGGTVDIFLNPQAPRMPILGRDVLNYFTVIFDRKRDKVLLITEPTDYQVIEG